MAIFAKFKKAKDAAVEHKKAAQQAKPATPYHHIPTHAAQDALAASPTTLTSQELQSRIAAARKRRASSYQAPMTGRQSVYYDCGSSRATSRANSMIGSPSGSTLSSYGKSHGTGAMDMAMQGSQSLLPRHSPPSSEHFAPVPAGPPAFPPPPTQRPRPFQATSRRSSYSKKRSPLSNTVEEGMS